MIKHAAFAEKINVGRPKVEAMYPNWQDAGQEVLTGEFGFTQEQAGQWLKRTLEVAKNDKLESKPPS